MKTSVKICGLLAGLALVASCSKEQNVLEEVEPVNQTEWDASRYLVSFGASTEDVTKADINLTSGAVTWNSGDRVLVYEPTGGTSAEYQYDGSKFVPVSTPVEINEGLAYAYYPSEFFTIDAGTVSITVPSAIAADPGNKLPMAGIIPAGQANPVCSFKQLGSIVWVKAKATRADGETLTKVKVVNTSLSLSGTGTVTWDGTSATSLPELGSLTVKDTDDNDVPCYEAASYATHKLDNSAFVDYYIFVPAGDMEDMELQFIYGKGAWNDVNKVHEYEPYQKMTRNASYTMARGKVLPVHGVALPGFFSGGDGSEEHPYQLSSLADLRKLAELSISSEPSSGYSSGKPSAFSATCAHYELTTDIDLDGEDWKPIGFDHEGSANTGNSTKASSPGKSFRGTFDGKNHEIQNFNPTVTLKNNKTYGFFGAIREATIKNLAFTNVDITYGAEADAAADAGILAGTISFGSTVENITIEGTLTSTGTATDNKRLALGGIAGFVFAGPDKEENIHNTYIKNCTVTLNITGDSGSNTKAGAAGVQAGALAGFSTVNADDSEARVTFENCTVLASTIDITCGRASGLVAAANLGTILKGCVNYANIENSFVNGRIGGLVCQQGINSALINCENRGNVTTTNNKTTTGGMVALIQGTGAYIQGGGNYGNVTTNFATDGSGRDFYGLVGANLNNFVKIDGVTVSGKLYKNGGSTLIDVTAENFIDSNYIGWWNNETNKAKITNCTYVAP